MKHDPGFRVVVVAVAMMTVAVLIAACAGVLRYKGDEILGGSITQEPKASTPNASDPLPLVDRR